MKIAVCDDDRQILFLVRTLLTSYQEQRRAELSCQVFENAVDLLAAMEHEHYELLLLDVLMPGLSGMEAAHEIRQKNEDIKIVFLTSSPEYAVESYSVQATNYLLKPATEERLFPILDRLADQLRKPDEALTIRTKGIIFRLPYGKIEYIEVVSKTLYFYLTDGTVKEVHASLSEYEPALLSRPCFCKVHRSYLVNLNWVTAIRQKELFTASGFRVPVSRAAYQQVRTAYTKFLFEDADIVYHNGGNRK